MTNRKLSDIFEVARNVCGKYILSFYYFLIKYYILNLRKAVNFPLENRVLRRIFGPKRD
jgi:hypothetical protein